jgi:hypothetical protein
MRLHCFSYRYAREILEHQNNSDAWNEIVSVASATPIFRFPGKSRNARLDIVQQLINTYFDRKFSVDLGWEYHPLATKIARSGLAADFRKKFSHITVQAEVQFGNAARWYSDIFKFQAAYAQSLIQCGLCVLPMGAIARRIDQNVASYERAVRELPSADLSITLPILIIGMEPDKITPIIDVSTSRFAAFKDVIKTENRWRLVNAHLNGQDIATIGPDSPTGPMLVDPEVGADGDGSSLASEGETPT